MPLPPLDVFLTSWESDGEPVVLKHFPDNLPDSPLPLDNWSLDIGLPLDGMGFRFEMDFPDVDRLVVCEVYAENGTVGVDREQGIEEQNDAALDEALIAWLMDACPAIIRHLFAPLMKGA
jgi:hypothetical protein